MEPPIQLSSATDRQTAVEQIAEVLLRAQGRKEPMRIRIPFTLYDYAPTRTYLTVRDAVWNLALPSDQTTPENIERLIETLGQCIAVIAAQGSDAVLLKLGELQP